MTQASEFEAPRLSRRGLFGAGLGRALDAQLAAFQAASGVEKPTRSAPPAGPASWDEGDTAALGARLEPARLALLEACAVTSGTTVLDLTAGDGALAELAQRAGALVTAIEPDLERLEALGRRCAQCDPAVELYASTPAAIKAGERSFAAVLSNFTASHHHDQRRVALDGSGRRPRGADRPDRLEGPDGARDDDHRTRPAGPLGTLEPLRDGAAALLRLSGADRA